MRNINKLFPKNRETAKISSSLLVCFTNYQHFLGFLSRFFALFESSHAKKHREKKVFPEFDYWGINKKFWPKYSLLYNMI